MKILSLFLFLAVVVSAVAGEALTLLRRTDGGILAETGGGKRVLFVAGTPEEMGRAQGELLAEDIGKLYDRILLVAGGLAYAKGEWFFDRIEEVQERSRPYMEERFYRECDAMSRAAGLTEAEGRQINLFPEMFHCSGVAVRGRASAGGRVRQVRVLDYMRDIGIQDYAVLTIVLPQEGYAWANVGYAGFIGSVTAMNLEGLAIGEMGGRGEGNWDGIPMNFLMRRIMEECRTVEEALELMRGIPHTCEYYYVLSDASGELAAVQARAGEEPVVLRPGEEHELLPRAFEDVVFVSAGERARVLAERIEAAYGTIDTPALIEMVKRPVAMASNLQNAVFEPETLDLYWADAGDRTLACDETYHRVNLRELADWYRRNSASE